MNNITYKLHINKEGELRKDLEKLNFSFQSAKYAFWRSSKEGITITFYKSGKLLIQGDKTSDLINYLIEKGFIKVPGNIAYSKWIGTDESGKGDYFGPLVAAGVYIKNEDDEERLKDMGVRDCKKLSNGRIIEIAKLIKRNFIYSIVLIGPEKYNELYEKLKNLNRILAWAHSRVIENILQKVDCPYVLTDQFGDKNYILNALMEKGKQIFIQQMPKAEEDIAVASASILARAEFLLKLESLSNDIKIELPRGSSFKVKEVAKEIVEKRGKNILKKVAKIHFKITKDII